MTFAAGLPLAGWKVLIVEDQFLIATDMRRMVIALGGEALGPYRSVEQARELLASQTPDFALLDINLDGKPVFELAEELSGRGVPFAFASGYDDFAIPEAHRGVPRLDKPLSRVDLEQAVLRLRADASPR